MQQININELKPHPRNNEFFDDMSGEKWKEFLESIKTRGVIEPIVITPDKVIVSGHQRVRAFKELGIRTIEGEIKQYGSEDEVLLDLIETTDTTIANILGDKDYRTATRIIKIDIRFYKFNRILEDAIKDIIDPKDLTDVKPLYKIIGT